MPRAPLSFTETIRKRAFPALPLSLAAAGAALLHSRYYVGFFSDDASFVLLARGLWERLFSFSSSGLSGAFSHFQPGYPAFLAPFAAAADPHWALLKLTTAGLSLLSVCGLWLLLGGLVGERARRWASLLYAVHPLLLLNSGTVMADPFLACLFVWGLYGLRRAVENPSSAAACALTAGACLWAAAAKPIGLLLPAAVTVGLAAARSRRLLLAVGLPVWVPILAAAAWSAAGGGGSDYYGYMSQGLASLSGIPVWQRAYGLLHAFVLVYGLALPWPRGAAWDAAGAAISQALAWLCVLGLLRLLRGASPGRETALAAGALLLGQVLVLSLWTVYSDRYALPMLPLALSLAAAGAGGLRVPGRYLTVLPAAAFIWLSAHSAWLAAETLSSRRPPESRFCGRTLEWIRSNTPDGARFSGRAVLVRLYTGRDAWGLSAAPDYDSFLLRLSGLGVGYALVSSQPVLSTSGPYRVNHAWQQAMERGWIRRHPETFKRIFSDGEEGTEIYSVKLPEGLAEAAALRDRALEEARAGRAGEAVKLLNRALKVHPGFVSASAALAVLSAQEKDHARAEKELRRALELEPNFPKAANLLAELLEKRGDSAGAKKVREKAEASRAVPPFEAEP